MKRSRTFALVVVATLGTLAYRLAGDTDLRMLGWFLFAALSAQFLLGLANVALGLPLALAVAHNAGAAVLMATMVVINYVSFHGLALRRAAQPPPA